MMKQHLKIMAALACLMGLGSTAVMAANWTDTLQQLAKSVPAVGQVLKGTEIQTTVPGIAATTETTTTQSGTEQQSRLYRRPIWKSCCSSIRAGP